MDVTRFLFAVLGLVSIQAWAAEVRISDDLPLQMPPAGAYELRVLAPTLLELTLVSLKQPDPARPGPWDFVDAHGECRLPGPEEFAVLAGGKTVPVKAVGFRRRTLYAPFKKRDLRVGNYLYLQLDHAIAEDQTVEVRNPSKKLWSSACQFVARTAPLRWSPVIHVNQTGYLPAYPKKAMVGYYLGSLGEMDVPQALASSSGKAGASATQVSFRVVDAQSGKTAFEGNLAPRLDQGFPYECYQRVLQADFSPLKAPGEYRLVVPGLGASFPFYVSEAVAGAFARGYALGLYHQRCGMANELPFTRFTHGPCHTAPAEVPDMSKRFAAANNSLQKETSNYKDNPRHTAPQLKDVASCLYPFVNRGPIDVRGGHHDAGDYSKYTINSATFINLLVFSADVFPGVADLDNLGLPESGDGKSDVLQEAKWEADFLAKMQDADGGFYFLVYPREREYEYDVTPDKGDPQVVFPKTTSVTAAATAALAQCASSPRFKQQFPEAAALYLEKAKRGWAFLERAIAKYGKDGAYQKITHYGDDFMHDDELAWAACEMFLATGDESYHKKLLDWLNPTDPNTRLWGWWRLYGSYASAIRSYAFAAKTGRLKREQQNFTLLEQCEDEIAAAGEDQLHRAQQSAYGTSFPIETKRARAGGWYFSSDAAFDLAVACQLGYPMKRDPRPQMMEALITNLDYEQGCNPVNVTFVTGLGWKRQREIVDQYAENDRRVLPPSGIPLGNIMASFGWLDLYKKEPENLAFPSDGSEKSPYPLYDRWSDAFNVTQEFVIVNQARALGYSAWLMAQTSLKNQPWKPVSAQITRSSAGGRVTATLSAPGLDLASARIVWEAAEQEPAFGKSFTFSPASGGPQWIEAEAQLPDGRRVFGVSDSTTK